MGVVVKVIVPGPSSMEFKVEGIEYESWYGAVFVTLH
jgi:hypothetical protein